MPTSSNGSSSTRSRAPVDLRPLRSADRALLESILRRTAVFADHEIAIALELIDAPVESGYRFFVAEADGRVAGYACYGRTPCTDGTWDLYWIAVDPDLHGRGVGRVLMDAVVAAVRADGGRMIVIETASKPSYDPTRAFYRAYGCREAARVPDFYAVGDDKVVYTHSLR